MNENQFDEVFKELKSSSRVSIIMVLIGVLFLAGSVYYSATRLRPLQKEIDSKHQEINRLKAEEETQRQKVKSAQMEYAALKASTEKLYAVRVTPTNEVYEVKATAQATGNNLEEGPEYKFSIFINSAPDVLANIASVTYRTDHPTFRKKEQTSTNSNKKFAIGYVGWGCLTDVSVIVKQRNGAEQTIDFNMCKSLGAEWTDGA